MTRPRGAPRKDTEPRIEAICEVLRRGVARRPAAEAAGVAYSTMRKWADDDPAIAARFEQAESEAQVRLLDMVRRTALTAGPNTWQAAAWILERRWPEHYGRKERLEISVDVMAEAKKIADELGLDVADVVAEAEAILSGNR
jgi:hypothetical protein